ncbi:MAG: WD40 repeat domain-containing protein [Firmicutes bacterium]|nr:WD40 repeat domain-containing protein [Bacillota bacterium]
MNPPPILIPLKNVDIIKDKTLVGHSGAVEELAFSPDGKILASGSTDSTIILWDVATGNKIRTLSAKTRFSSFAPQSAFSPDGKILASVMGREALILWDIATGNKNTLYESTATFDVAFSPDGKAIANGSNDKGISLWDVQTGKKIKTLKGHLGALYSVRFSPNGNTLAAASEDRSIVFWDVKTGNKVKTFKGHSAGLYSIAFSPDGKTLASAGVDKSIILWDVTTGNRIKTIEGLPRTVYDLAFSPDGKMLAAAVGSTFILLDLETGEGSGKSYEAYCVSVAFSPDSRILATGSEAYEKTPQGYLFHPEKAIFLWDVSSWEIKRKFRKDEFETTMEYEARVSQVEVPYSIPITLRKEQYNADRGGFEIGFKGNKLFIPVEKGRAKELVSRKMGEIKLVGKLKYYNTENLMLIEGGIVDSVTQERYAVYKIKE